MKLLTLTSRYFLLFSISLLSIGSIIMVLALDWILTQELDENLLHTRGILLEEINSRDSVPDQLFIMGEMIDFTPIEPNVSYSFYQDTLILIEEEEDEDEPELEPFRKYVYTEFIQGKNYRVELNHSKFEKEDLAFAVIGLLLGFLAVFLLLINLFNRFISKRIWQPFYRIIEQIQGFKITDSKGITSQPTTTDEFKLLSHNIEKMTAKLVKDYQSLKHFSENASHELQTPLAIILAQTDLMFQRPNLDHDSAQHLAAIQQASKRLTQLSHSLLLLTKIENRQFSGVSSLSLDQLVNQELDVFAPIIEYKSIHIKRDLTAMTVRCNQELLTILLQNLISNAIKHNHNNGALSIFADGKILVIENTCHEPLISDTDELFDRFRQGNTSKQSLGLGLAIVREICELYHWDIQYQVVEQRHRVSILFQKK